MVIDVVAVAAAVDVKVDRKITAADAEFISLHVSVTLPQQRHMSVVATAVQLPPAWASSV